MQDFGARAMAVEVDIRRAVACRETFFPRAVDVEIDAGEAWIGEGGEEGIDALQAGEGAEKDGGRFIRGRALDVEAGGVGTVFE